MGRKREKELLTEDPKPLTDDFGSDVTFSQVEGWGNTFCCCFQEHLRGRKLEKRKLPVLYAGMSVSTER